MRDAEFHRIRLHGPWQANVRSGEGGADPPKTFRFQWPADWPGFMGPDLLETKLLWPGFRGSVQIERRFNKPTGLEAEQPVFLVIEQVDFDGQVTLNGQHLGTLRRYDALRVEIAKLLSNHNLLSIEITEIPNDRAQNSAKGPPSSATVGLEITSFS